jgi:type VI secretion system protein ImpF
VSRFENSQGLMPSMVDRLIDPESGGTSARRGYGLEQMVEVVRRDLEDLLNTRQSFSNIPPEFDYLRKSVLAYGLPDFTSMSASTNEERGKLGAIIERIVEQHEPRLKSVRALLVKSETDARSVRFHIEARLRVEPSPEVGFETTLELTTGHASIQASKG